MYKLLISLKYLRGRIITGFAILFVALGVMTLIVVNSVMTGFQKEFKARLRGTLSHMTVRLESPKDYPEWAEIIRGTEHVAAVAPRKEGLVLMAWHGRVEGCKVLGVDPAAEYEVSEFRSYLMTPYRDFKDRLQRVSEDRDVSVVWELRGVAEDRKGRRIAYFLEHWTDTSHLKNGAIPPMKSLVRFDAEGLVHLYYKRLQRDFPVDMRSSGPEFDAAQAWFVAFNKEMEANAVEKVAARFAPDMRTERPALDPKAPFALDGGRIKQDYPGIVVGNELFFQLGMSIGTKVELITARVDREKVKPGQPIGENDLRKEGRIFVVCGAFKTGMNEYDSNFIYAPYAEMASLLDEAKGNVASIRLTNFEHADAVRASLNKRIKPRMYVQTWRDKRRNLLRAVDMERGVMFVIMFFFILFAIVTIAVILILLVVEKYRDIGILKSMGASSWGVASIFVFNGLVAGAIGCALGTVGGVLFATHVNEISDVIHSATGFTVFPRDVYYLDRIPSDVDPYWIGGTVAIALGLCLLCCLVPAYKAGRLQVVDTLKWE